jgi:hypothetical protein
VRRIGFGGGRLKSFRVRQRSEFLQTWMIQKPRLSGRNWRSRAKSVG